MSGWLQGDAAPGTLPQNATCSGSMAPVVSEAALYTQLAHFHRVLDAPGALARLREEGERAEAARKLAPARGALDAGAAAVDALRNRCAFRWVSLAGLYSVTAASGA